MKSIFATPEDLVRNLANLATVNSDGDSNLEALNRMIDEARALCEAQPDPTKAPKAQLVYWVVSVKGVTRLTSHFHVSATSEQTARERAIEIARGYALDDFDTEGPEDLTVSSIERVP